MQKAECNGASWKWWLLGTIIVWFAVAAGDRLVWANAGGGVQGYLGAGVGDVRLEGCEGRGVEYKAGIDADTFVYRCNTIGDGPAMLWPFRHGGESTALAAVISKSENSDK
ncbi:hypothetical protein LPN04_29520 [Rugamonas sp. A1-17]|nr:hypothetical protein [Rugamonas sp. A1-17]